MHPDRASDMPVFWKLFVLHHLGARIVTLKMLPKIECFGNGGPLASYLSFSSDLDMPPQPAEVIAINLIFEL